MFRGTALALWVCALLSSAVLGCRSDGNDGGGGGGGGGPYSVQGYYDRQGRMYQRWCECWGEMEFDSQQECLEDLPYYQGYHLLGELDEVYHDLEREGLNGARCVTLIESEYPSEIGAVLGCGLPMIDDHLNCMARVGCDMEASFECEELLWGEELNACREMFWELEEAEDEFWAILESEDCFTY